MSLDEYGYADAQELIERKKAGERTVLDEATTLHWRARVQRAFELLDQAHAASQLPEEAPNVAELEAWLIDVRMRVAATRTGSLCESTLATPRDYDLDLPAQRL